VFFLAVSLNQCRKEPGGSEKGIAHGHWEQGFMQRSNSNMMETHNVWIQKWSEFQRWWKNKLQYLPDVFVH